ncbi:hypothetical protein STIAU_2511 [Stigmatella aurantiaca DW4/3-1]|nr:hypothetical protein STIAU_2511 [Stigmatella aurantiaca DW4/3-1]
MGPEEGVGTQQSALCAALSVTTLTTVGISSYGGEIAGNGAWAVSPLANAARLEYRVDGVLRTVDERPGNSGFWFMSSAGTTCGTHTVEVKAYPMVIDSNGNRTTCLEAPRTLTQSVVQECPTASLSCPYASPQINCTASGSGGTGGYTYFWKESISYPDGTEYTSSWYPGGPVNGFYCPPVVDRSETTRNTLSLKVRDSAGLESPSRMFVRMCGY